MALAATSPAAQVDFRNIETSEELVHLGRLKVEHLTRMDPACVTEREHAGEMTTLTCLGKALVKNISAG